jgi:membrane-associated phospholipid phosphatase
MDRGEGLGVWLLLLSLGAGAPAAAQSSASSPSNLPEPSDSCPSPCAIALGERPVSWKLLVPNIVHDQKPIWLFPETVAHGRHWNPVAGFLFATAGLVALDPHAASFFRGTNSFAGFNKDFSGSNTALGTAIVPLSWCAVGVLRKDPYAQHTSLLAGEAVADVEILTTALKGLTHRLRPSDVPTNGNFSDTWFEGHGSVIRGNGSFPSGHTIAAFSVATVFADRYRRHGWVPWVAYGLASMVGFSRLTLQAHFSSDVFAGAALGYVVSHYVVLGSH